MKSRNVARIKRDRKMRPAKVKAGRGHVAKKILREHAGEYVAISNSGTRVIASGSNGAEVVAAVDRKGIDSRDYFIKYVRPHNLPLVR